MLPLFKLFSLFVRILARPVIARTKSHTSQKLANSNMRMFFVWCGNRTHHVNVMINRKFLKLNSADFKVHELSENAALELGVETFYEIIIYLCILGLPIIEIYNNYVEGNEKSAKQKALLDSIGSRLNKLDEESVEAQKRIAELLSENSLLSQKAAHLEDIVHKVESRQNDQQVTLLSIPQATQQIQATTFSDMVKANQL